MRTKALLSVAAALAAGALTAQAQVYSVNIVGYINQTLEPGNNLVSAPLLNGSNTLSEVYTNLADNSYLTKWDFANQKFFQADTYYAGFGWFDNAFNPSTTTVKPGEGFFIYNPAASNVVVTLVGEVVPKGNVTNVVYGPGNAFYGNPIPSATSLATNANGFANALGDNSYYYTFITASNKYSQALTYYQGFGWYDGAFNPQDPVPNVGQGFQVNNTGTTTNWVQNFNP